MPSEIVGGVHGSQLDAATWRALEELYDRVWPGLPRRLRVAERLGARWADHTTPFTWFEGGRALATVGVLEHPIVLHGRDVVVAGIHSVGTDPDLRGKGLCGALLDAALTWVDERFTLAKLSTAVPAVFTSRGFRTLPTARFAVPLRAPDRPGSLRRVDLDDADQHRRMRDRLARRTPVSDVIATRDPGWLCLIDAAIERVTDRWFFEAPTLDAVLVAERGEREWIVHDVISAGPMPELGALASVLPGPFDRIVLGFTPDRIAPAATAEPVHDIPDVLAMVRGPWPALPPVGIPPLWEH